MELPESTQTKRFGNTSQNNAPGDRGDMLFSGTKSQDMNQNYSPFWSLRLNRTDELALQEKADQSQEEMD